MIQLEITHLFTAIEKLRIARKIPQKDLCRGIMDPSTYSKIKKGELSLNLKDSYEFLSRLNASWADIQSLNLFSNPAIDKVSKRFNKLTADPKVPIEEIEILFIEISKMDLQNSELLRLYLLLKKYYGGRSTLIPKISSCEMNSLFQRIEVSTILTSIDYLFIGDLTSEFTLKQLQTIHHRILVTNFEEFLIKPRVFKIYIPQCVANIADIFIDNGLYTEAKLLLENLKQISIIIDSFFNMFLTQFLSYRLQYFETNDPYILEEYEKWMISAQTTFPDIPSLEVFKQSFTDLKNSEKTGPKIIFRTP